MEKPNEHCPKCNREWQQGCEQAICIDLYGECIMCRFSPGGKGSMAGTESEWRKISDAWRTK